MGNHTVKLESRVEFGMFAHASAFNLRVEKTF